MNPPPVFVISLARAMERREDIVRRLNTANIRHEIVDGVDGNKLDLAEIGDRMDSEAQMKYYGRPLYRGEFGCYLSHYNLWRRIVAEKIPAAVVLEDDAVWEDDFSRVISGVAECGYEWDVALLHAGVRKSARVVCDLGGGRKLACYKRHHVLTTGYLISLSGAEKLTKYCWRICHPIDLAWKWQYRWAGKFYAVMPPVVKPSGAESIILKMAKESGENKFGNRHFSPPDLYSRSILYWENKGNKIAALLYFLFLRFKKKQK